MPWCRIRGMGPFSETLETEMAKARKGMGFKAAMQNVMRNSGVSPDAAGAIVASAARNASPAAKAANPNLRKVKGSAKGKPAAKGKAPAKKAAPKGRPSSKRVAPKKKAAKK